MDRLSQLFAQQIAFSYGCLDRIVIRGYYPALQRPENVIHFLHDVVGAEVVDSGALASRTTRYREWLDDYVRDHRIERLPAPKGVKNEDFVLPYYRRLGRQEGIACILTSMEEGTTFVSYEPRFKTKNEAYRIVKRCRKRFQHLYFYLFDPVMGPMCLRVGTYLPFAVQAYLNGHSFVAEQLTRQGVGFHKHDNAILAVDDVAALQAAAAALTPDVIRQRCDYWTRRLAPRFTEAERKQAHLAGYHYSVAQVEYAHDLIFRRQAPLQALFRRLAELGAFLGGADRTMTVFGRRINRRYKGKLMTVLEGAERGQPVLRSYYQSSYAKLYEKLDQYLRALVLRAEMCANDPYHLAVNRGLEFLPSLVDKMAGAAQRYLDLHAELLDTTVDSGELAGLAQPTWRGQRRIPGLRLQDDRVLRLLDVLLQPASCIAGWTVADLHARVLTHYRLGPDEYRPAQLRYDLWKLRAKGLVERLGTSRQYRVTERGVRLGTPLIKLRYRLLGPLASAAAPSVPHDGPHPSSVEMAFRQVETALDHLCSTLGLKAA